MRLESFRARGFGPFKAEFSADLSELRGLVAITGVNGAGKSTFLELGLPGALYRQTPTRGSLGDLAVARDACLDVTVVNGSRWTIRHLVDGQSKKAEVLVLKDGVAFAPLSSGKVKEFDAFAASHFPAPEVLMSTIFGAQGAGGFLAAKPAERKAILLRVLGVERLEKLAEQARERLKAGKVMLETTAARLADERSRGGNVAALEAELATARDHLRVAEAYLSTAEASLAAGEQAQRDVAALLTENARLAQERATLDLRLAEAKKKLSDTQERIANNRAVLADGPAIRAAVAELAEQETQLRAAETEFAAATAEHRAALEPWANVSERIGRAESRAERAKLRGRDAAAVSQAKLALPALRDALAEAEGEVTRIAAQLDELQGARIAGAGERLAGLRSTLETVHNMVGQEADLEDIDAVVVEALGVDDEAVTASTQTPLRISELRERQVGARDRLAVAQRQLADAERLTARAAEVEGAAAERAEAETEAKALREGHSAAAAGAEAKASRCQALTARAQALRSSVDALRPAAGRQQRLDAAETRITELEPQATEQANAVEALGTQLAALPAPAPVPPAPDLDRLRGTLREWREAAAAGNRTVAALEQRHEQAKASADRQTELVALEQAQLTEVSDWTRVAANLGRDGLQALEIDAAGPELTAVTNSLLHGCLGPRFTLRVETQRASADGKRTLEGCDVMVLDTVQGREAAGETFSGGERVLLAEALSLAILVVSCRRAGLTDVSLVRDESGAALDPANARVYVAMLRKAIEMIGARHCLLVSHMPEVQELCDHRIEVGGAS